MKFFYIKFIVTSCWLFLLHGVSAAQGFSFNCVRDTVLPGCPANLCFTLKTLIPDPQRQSTTYTVNAPATLPSCLLASNNPGNPGAPTTLSLDDRYSPSFAIGFPFTFFGTPYNNLVVSSNGYLSFDASLAGTMSHWNIINGGSPQNLPSTFYNKALIMGPYHDIDVSITTSPNRLISYQTMGLAPYRSWVLTYYKIPLFSASCNNLIENTHQIILYESTGIIDVILHDMQICSGWNQGRAMVGVQNFNRDIGVMVPGRRASDPPWGSIGMSERWRFVPIGGTPLFRRVELYDLAGNFISTGTTVQLPNGDREASFANVCPPAGVTTSYVFKAFYDKIDDPTTEIFGTDTINVNRTLALAATPVSTSATCGNNNGTISINNTSGGVAPYQYSLDGINWVPGNVFSGLASGTYSVYVRDNPVACTSTYQVTVGVISNLTATTTSSSASCTGLNNGTITITSSMGTGPFTYSLDGGVYQSGPLPFTFSNLAPGIHTVIVKDVNNCTTNSISITIATGSGITSITTVTATACGTPTGSITITPSGGTAPYTYQLGSGTIQPSNAFTGLAAGTYTITIRDNIGCVQTITRTVSSNTTISANFNTTATSCSGATNGTVVVTPINGTSPYQFSIDGGSTNTNATSWTFTNLSAGTHAVRITDAIGCVRTQNIFISTGPAFTASSSPIATSCSGASNGSISVISNGGAAPYSFILDGGTPVAGTSPFTFTNVAAGPHTVIVRDGGGCVTNTMGVIVSSGPAFITSVSKTDALCNGSATGSITVTPPVTGTAPYQYSLDGTTWQASNIFPGIMAGTYTVYYRESSGCQGNQSITVGEQTAMTTSATTVAVICNGQNNGIITVTAGGGISPYEYSIDGGTSWQSNNIFNTSAGNYSITIRDANNCITTQAVTVTEPAILTATSINGPASCNGGNDGVITLSAAGGNAGYQYSLDGISFQASNIFNVAPGNYTITIKDNLGCTANFTTTVLLGSNFTLVRQPDTTICEGKSTQLALTSNALQYTWSPAIGLSSTTIFNPVANPVVTTQYIVSATLGRCTGFDTVIVRVNAAPIPNAGPDGFICYGQKHQLQASGGTLYSWTPSTFLNSPLLANPIASAGRDIVYTLSILSDINGCASLTTDQMRIDVTPPIKVKTFPYDTIGYTGDQIQILAVSSDSDVINYSWSPSTGLNNPTIANPIVTVSAIGDVVKYQVITSTIAGCSGEGYVTIRVYKGPDIYMPTGFTPNGDGKNDRFTPFPVGIKSLNYYRIFNRWGQLIFSTNRLHEGWDGKLGGADQQSGVYVWMIEGVTKDDRVITKKGTVALIR